jgi:hypothetical protein
MRCIATYLSLSAVALFSPIAALAQIGTEQAASGTTSDSCVQRPDATWVPCGPNRTLSEAEVRTLILREKDGLTAKVFGTSGTSGKQFFINIAPGGKLESGLLGGRNVGKSWKFDGGKLCRSYYAPVSDVHCGVFEVADGNLYLLDIGDVKKSLINRIEYANP